MPENKEYMSHQEELGTIQISEEVVASIASAAVLEVENVTGLMSANVSDFMGGKNMTSRGVRVEMDGDAIMVNVFITVRYGCTIGEVAKKAQNAVYQALESTTGYPVSTVNVHVGGISLNKTEKKREKNMTRNTAREIAMHLAFELSFTDLPIGDFLDQYLSDEKFAELAPECELYAQLPNAKQESYIRRLVSGVAEHAAELDTYIEKYAKGWRFERISLVASAIMRLAMYEIMYMPDIPHGVAINEAVELTRKYDEPETAKFVNGILGSFLRQEVKE